MQIAISNRPGSRLALAGCAGILLILLIIAVSSFLHHGTNQDAAHELLTNTINEKVAALNIKSRTDPSLPEEIARVRDAIARSDFSTAQQITTDVLANSHIQNWRFYPFSEFIAGIFDLSDPALQSHLDAWVDQNRSNAIPVLIRAQYDYAMGWSKRGQGFIRDTQDADLAAFESYMQKALVDIDTAMRLNDGIPYSFELKLKTLRGTGQRPEMMTAFATAINKYPAYYPLYQTVLSTLEPKWGGKVKAMYDFVDQYAGAAPENSPLKLLYLNLYADLLSSSSTACWSYQSDKDKMPRCVASVMERTIRPDLEKQVQDAFYLYAKTDHYQFGIALKPILENMLSTKGGDMYSGAMLQWAADAMHSNTQLVETTPSSNDYIIDLAVADSWYDKKFFDNALKKDEEALKDVEAMRFPNGEAKDLAVAGIYRATAQTYGGLGNFAQMIAYEEAAIALGGRNGQEHSICYGYYKLKQFDDALRACTRVAEYNPDNLSTFYWRGQLYRDLGQTDDALHDLTRVADSYHGFRHNAAIDMSMIYFNRHDNQSALHVLNKYPYLYDAEANTRDGVAVAYNNRCYAYMELGDLRNALDDCTASLKFGSLPDAYRKQEELIKRLGTDKTQL